MALSREQLAARLALDYRVATALRAPCLGSVRAYSDQPSFDQNNPITTDAGASIARIYRVDYKIHTLKGPGEFLDHCVVKLDIGAGGRYPLSPPLATVVSRPTPWSPHFHIAGIICIGGGWIQARGKMLLAQLIIHIAKLLNFDEPGHGPNYAGYNAAAARYWHDNYKGKPLNPDLVYPDLPTSLVHGERPEPRFAPRFCAAGTRTAIPAVGRFRAVSSRETPATPMTKPVSIFKPRTGTTQ